MSWKVMLIIEVMCIPHALIMLVRTHMDIYIGVCWILLHAAVHVQSDHGRDWWISGSYTDGASIMVHHGSLSGPPCECASSVHLWR